MIHSSIRKKLEIVLILSQRAAADRKWSVDILSRARLLQALILFYCAVVMFMISAVVCLLLLYQKVQSVGNCDIACKVLYNGEMC